MSYLQYEQFAIIKGFFLENVCNPVEYTFLMKYFITIPGSIRSSYLLLTSLNQAYYHKQQHMWLDFLYNKLNSQLKKQIISSDVFLSV
jgi:hypothetical protein